MNTSTHNQSLVCRILMLCEDNTAFIRAMDLRDSLATECRGQAIIYAIFSRFDWLYQPMLRQHAGESVENADLIIVVAEGSRDLPPVARTWLAGLTRQPHARKPALALYLEHHPQPHEPDEPDEYHSTEPSTRIRAFLQQVAASLDVDFFSNLIPHNQPEPDSLTPNGHEFALTPQNLTRLLQPLVPSHPPLL